MASLTNTKISDTYPLLLKIETNGVDGTLRSIEDGDGTASALKISNAAIQVDNIKIDGNAITSTDSNGNIDLTPDGSGEVNISKVDIDSGTIDGVSINSSAIGASSASTGAFTTISASGNVDFNGDLDVDGTTNLDVVDIDGATTITGTSAYAASATNLSTSVSKMALRVQGSNDASTSLWMGALANDAQQYIQACNDAGNGADDIVLNPFGGRVGVGVENASPSSGLHLQGGDNTASKFTLTNTANSNSWSIHPQYNDQTLRFLGDSTTVLTMKDTGEVGIGDTSPSAKLTINGGINNVYSYSTTTTDQPGFVAANHESSYTNLIYSKIYGSGVSASAFGVTLGNYGICATDGSSNNGLIVGTFSNKPIIVGTNSTEKMRITNDGKVGIGTDNPSDQLTISNSGEASVAIIGSAGVGGGDATLYLVENNTNFGIRMRYDGGDDRLYINADEDTRNLMTIERDGSGVGIGTTTPNFAQLTRNLTIHDLSNNVGLEINRGATAAAPTFYIATETENDIILANRKSGYIRLATDNLERMKIASDGTFTFKNTSARFNFYADSTTDIVQYFGGHDTDGDIRIAGSIAVATTAGSNACDGELIFATASGNTNTERMRILSGGGITFNGDTATANALDDYEEGTWTPVINRITVSPTVSYSSNRYGAYTKIGNMVFASFDVTFNSISGGSGSAILSGLPFTVSDTNDKFAGYSVLQQRAAGGVAAGGSGQQLSGFAQRNAAYLYLQYDNSGTSGYDSGTGASWNSSGRFTGYIMYIAA